MGGSTSLPHDSPARRKGVSGWLCGALGGSVASNPSQKFRLVREYKSVLGLLFALVAPIDL